MLFTAGVAGAQTPLGEWWHWPSYVLGQRAAQYPGPRLEAPATPVVAVRAESIPILFHGEEPTERVIDFIDPAKLPTNAFTLEWWLVNHVNQPVGAAVIAKSRGNRTEPLWLVGVYARDIVFSLKTTDNPFANLVHHQMKSRAWKKYWMHVAATYDGKEMKLYLNGELLNTLPVGKRVTEENAEFEVAAYMNNEPYMDLGNLVKMTRLYDVAISQKQVAGNYARLQEMVVEGKLFPNLFHFNAGPYLNAATTTGITILWETDRPADFVVEYGKQVPMDKKIELHTQTIRPETGSAEGNIYSMALENLEPETQYFYNIKAVARDGSTIESGMFTFATAVKEHHSFSFGVMGDTEARPHINDRISKMLWDERPNFIVNVGDLTDGGMKDHKFEWNYEYFQGVTQLTSRMPVFPVPGNGEADLHWYNRYHRLPPEGYYTFQYGNAQFFMLDSNRPDDFAPGGKQYVWLEEQLKKSTATWKFVAHHHAPYSADEDDYGNSWKGSTSMGDPRVRKIVSLYEQYGVDMVFFGHLHTYQRTLPIRQNQVNKQNGVIYVQGGGGGGNLEDFAPSRAWFSAKTYRGHHYFLITVFENELNFKMYDTEGRLKDYLDLKK